MLSECNIMYGCNTINEADTIQGNVFGVRLRNNPLDSDVDADELAHRRMILQLLQIMRTTDMNADCRT